MHSRLLNQWRRQNFVSGGAQVWRREKTEYKLLCPRGTQTCALAVANIKVNGNGKVILDTNPESDQHQN